MCFMGHWGLLSLIPHSLTHSLTLFFHPQAWPPIWTGCPPPYHDRVLGLSLSGQGRPQPLLSRPYTPSTRVCAHSICDPLLRSSTRYVDEFVWVCPLKKWFLLNPCGVNDRSVVDGQVLHLECTSTSGLWPRTWETK